MVGTRPGEGKSALFFGLPGNPVAVMATFYVIVREALLAMSGATPHALPLIPATSIERIAKRPGRTEFQRGIARREHSGRDSEAPGASSRRGHKALAY